MRGGEREREIETETERDKSTTVRKELVFLMERDNCTYFGVSFYF